MDWEGQFLYVTVRSTINGLKIYINFEIYIYFYHDCISSDNFQDIYRPLQAISSLLFVMEHLWV
jgi:hypothetical protein